MTYNIIENEFQRSQSSAYQLSILVGMDSLVYSIYDDVVNKLLVFRSLSFSKENSFVNELDELINKEDFFDPLYRRVKIAFLHSPTSLIPERLYNEQEKGTYLKEITDISDKAITLTDLIGSLNIRTVYNLDKDVSSVLKSKFPTAHFFSVATPFLTGCHQNIPEGAGETAFACFHQDTFQFALFEKGDLLFYNHFNFKSASDVLYFVLLSFEQYGLDPNSVPLFISGQVITDSDIYKLLYRYVAELSFQPNPTFVRLGKSASSIDPNFFFPLHSLLLCK